MSELIEWVCTRCEDRVCKCQVPPDTYPYQALVCVSFVPEWRVVGVVSPDKKTSLNEEDEPVCFGAYQSGYCFNREMCVWRDRCRQSREDS